MKFLSASDPFQNIYVKPSLSKLALRVVTARVLIVLSGSFMSQIHAVPTLTSSLSQKGYTVPNVESQVFTSNITPLSGNWP